jgi:hypothetical protein
MRKIRRCCIYFKGIYFKHKLFLFDNTSQLLAEYQDLVGVPNHPDQSPKQAAQAVRKELLIFTKKHEILYEYQICFTSNLQSVSRN